MSGVSEPRRVGRDDSPAAAFGYKRLKERIAAAAEKMIDLEVDREACLELREKLEANAFNLVVVGQFKRGKTCLINSLLGADLLPVSVVPLTSIVTILAYGEKPEARIVFQSGEVAEVPLEALSEYVTESGNPRNERGVREAVVLYPSSYLKDGVRLVDTPGVGSVYVHNTDVAYRYLPKSDAALFLLSVDQPVGSAEVEFLSDVRQFSDRIFFLMNKIDYLAEEEIGRALSFSQDALERVMGQEVRVFPISAKLALSGKREGSTEMLARSGLPAFSEVLDRFLVKEKGKVLLGSAARNLLRILSRARLEIELELKSLKTPVEEIRDKIAAFEKRKADLVRERLEFDALFNAEVNRLLVRQFDRDLAELKSDLVPGMEAEFDRFREQKKDLSLKELNDALENFVRERIRAQFSAWREIEDDKLSDVFDGICRNFSSKLNGVLDSLLDFSSQLFSIPFEPVEAGSLWTSESGFYFKLREEAVGLEMLTASLTQVFPRYISGRFARLRSWAYRTANRVILSKRRQHMLEAIEMQSGRLRSDFIERLHKSMFRFQTEMIKKTETVSEGIAKAIERGMDLRAKGEEEAARLEAALSVGLSAMDGIRDELWEIRDAAETL